MKPYYQSPMVTIHCGDCIEVMATMPENSVDAIVTDPPYGLEFMGKEWDRLGGEDAPGYKEKPRMTNDHMGISPYQTSLWQGKKPNSGTPNGQPKPCVC